jgi:chemotaxis protein MotD
MTTADNLLAVLRQGAIGKATPHMGAQHAPNAKDGKDNADHFRDQLRMVAHATKLTPKADGDIADQDAVLGQGMEVAVDETEAADDAPTRTKDRRSTNAASRHVATDTTAIAPEWRGPDAVLSAVLSRLDQAQIQAQESSTREQGPATRAAHPTFRNGPDDMLPDMDAALELSTSDGPTKPRFASAVDTTETRLSPAVKVAVREQETHFEPVQQVTLLQKIVDQLTTDLSTPGPQTAANTADVGQPDIQRAADKPLRMLTLELDPPNLGAVTVRMRMAGDAVEIRLTADKLETMHMLQKERGALSDAMQSAGYTFDIAAIDHTRAGDVGSGAGQQQAQPDHKPSQQSFSGSPFDGGSSGRQSDDTKSGTRQHRQEHEQRAEPVERHQGKDIVRNRHSGAVYL